MVLAGLESGVGAPGLTDREAARRLAERGRPRPPASSRSYASIVSANVLTVFNAILAGFGVLTLVFGDWRDALFLGVIVANSGIGITQEVRARRALDRLSLLVAPHGAVVRDGRTREIPVEEIVPGDLVTVAPGDQVLADGRLLDARELRLDESILTGESELAPRAAGEEVLSGAFVVEGAGSYLVSAVGEQSFAARVTGEARTFRHPRSPLERAINRLLYALVALVFALGALLGYSLYHRHASLHTAVATSAAGVVSLIPEGLVVLVSLTYALAAVRMARRGVLAQQLNAIESLASVEVLCIDKTGTLTEPALRVVEVLPAAGVSEQRLRAALADFAAGATARNATLRAIAAEVAAPDGEPLADPAPGVSPAAPAVVEAPAVPPAAPAPGEPPAGPPRPPLGEVPFASARRWSAVAFADETLYLGAPGRLPLGSVQARAEELQRAGRRVLALAAGPGPPSAERGLTPSADRGLTPSADPGETPLAGLTPLGAVVLAERLRPAVSDTIAFLRREGVEIKVLSGDAPATVAAIARDVGIPVEEAGEGESLPADPAELQRFAARASVVGRISPQGKRAFVQALHDQGRYVAMVGDGVNDVPALKNSRLAIAQGSGTQMARGVADLVLVSGDFASVPLLLGEGRRALRNLQRVTKLYVTKSAFAAFLILAIGTSSEAYPLLPRHLTLAASLTIGVPTFFLALAPSAGAWRPERLVRSVARFAVPAGTLVGTGVVAGYLFALHDLDLAVGQARTVAVTILVACGLYLVLALEAEGGSPRRSTVVAGMCAALAGLYAGALLLPATRHFFALSVLTPGMLATAALASAASIGALALCGFTVRVGSP